MNVATVVLALALTAVLSSCVDLQYYQQSIKGHLAIVLQTQDIQELLAQDTLDPQLRKKLQLVLGAREYAANTLHLSFNDSFSQYAELHRDYVVQNLYAAPEFSTELYTWCYPMIGCANYRGFFDLEMLHELQQDLDRQGYDTYVSNVTAYSTLGWFADPVLNTFVALDDYQLVALVFHELAHQQIYVSDDTFFNESFAMAVEQAGIELFYSAEGGSSEFQVFLENQQAVSDRVDLAVQAREDLTRVYQQPLSNAHKRKLKQDILQELSEQFLALTERPSPAVNGGTAPNFEFNNARLGAVAAYHKFVPAFLQILSSHGGDFVQFYAHVDMLGQLAAEQRTACLVAWSQAAEAQGETVPAMCAHSPG